MANGGAGVSGKFLLRPKGKSSDFVLSVIYKGNPTHHMVIKVDGEFTLNNQSTGLSKINDVVEHYRSKRPKWPVPLTDGVVYGAAKAKTNRDSGLDQSTSAPTTSNGADGDSCPYLHMKCSKGNADQLLLANDGDGVSGKFLVRSKGGSVNDYILSVIYKGAPTHHVLARESLGAEFMLNKQPTGETTLNGVLETYRKKRPKWPVPLTNGVRAKGGGTSPPLPASSSSAAPSGQKGGGFNFLHKNISKSQADALLLANGGSGKSGKFLVRSKGSSGVSYVLSVIYKGAATHHILAQESAGGEFLLNKQPTGETTVAGVVQRYRTKQPKWPVPLTEGVPSGDVGDGAGNAISATPAAAAVTAPSKAVAVDAPRSSPPPPQSTASQQRSTPRTSAPPSRAASPPPPARMPAQPPAPVVQLPAEPELVSFDMSEYFHGKLSQSDAEKILLGDSPVCL